MTEKQQEWQNQWQDRWFPRHWVSPLGGIPASASFIRDINEWREYHKLSTPWKWKLEPRRSLTEHLDDLFYRDKETFGPCSTKPFTSDPVEHQAKIPFDDGGPVVFRWHFTRGMLKPRMSGLELCEFIIKHMPAIVPLLGDNPRVQAEFAAMLLKLVTTPREKLDVLIPWIRSVTKQEDGDVLVMSLFDRTEQSNGPTYFVPGVLCPT